MRPGCTQWIAFTVVRSLVVESMTNEAHSGTQGHTLWQGRLRRLRFFRILLVIALALVGGNAARISLARLGPPSHRVATVSSPAESSPGESQANLPSADAAKAAAVRETPDAEPSGGPTVFEREAAGAAAVDAVEPHQAALRTAGAGRNAEAESPDGRSVLASRVAETAERLAAECRSSLAGNWTRFSESVKRAAAWGRSVAPGPIGQDSDLPPAEGCALYSSPHSADDSAQITGELPWQGDVVLSNPFGTGGVVRFLVNGELFSLGPGESRHLDFPGPWFIQFHRGGDFGDAEYTVGEGVYAFRVTEAGWDLQRAASADLP
jgi:hypothetical protein